MISAPLITRGLVQQLDPALLVQAPVGGAEQLVDGSAVGRERSGADRQIPVALDVQRLAALGDPGLDPAAHGDGAVLILLEEEQAHLIAAETADDVVGPGRISQQLGGVPQELVAGMMALGVVDGLQPAHVDVGEHEWALVALGASELPLNRVVEAAPVQ